MKVKLIGIFVSMLLIALALPTEGNLNINNIKKQNINNCNISSEIFGNTQTISNVNKVWSIIATYPIPEGASGLAYDGSNLFCGIYGANGDEIYQINPNTGSYQLKFNGPQEDAFGLTYDGQYLWTTDHPGSTSIPAVAMQLDMNGNLISQFDLPDHYMSGIAYDDGDFWVATYYPDPATIYNVDDSGSILDQFTAPDDQPWDFCLENDNLWMADYWGDTLYKIDPSTGDLLESHASEGVDPAGIVFDGSYLWYCDNGVDYNNDYLYKVDIGEGDNPKIYVPVTNHDYGIIAVGDSITWNATVENIGTADLIINDITFIGSGSNYLICSLTFPITLIPEEQTAIPLVYTPQEISELIAIAWIESNDPINPDLDLTLTGNAIGYRPDAPSIDGEINGDIGTEYEYTFVSTDLDGGDVYYWIEWGDGDVEEWDGPYDSGADANVKHTWMKEGTYIIKAQAKDDTELISSWGTLTVTMPRNRASFGSYWFRFIDMFPILQRLLQLLSL